MENNPITWVYIKSICDKCDIDNTDLPIDAIINTRSEIVEKDYTEWKLKVGEINLYDTLFKDNNLNAVLRMNDFRYNFENDIIHYVVWLRPKQTKYLFTPRMDKILLQYITKQLKYIYNNEIEIIHFRNNPYNRTIHSIDHYHVLVKVNWIIL